MSDWKTHVSVGFICTIIFLIICYFTTIYDTLEIGFISSCLVVSFIYSQLPDIDTQASKIRWILTIVGVGIAFISDVFFENTAIGVVCLGIVLTIWIMGLIKGFGHRGITHTIIAACVLSALLLYWSIWLASVGLINYISHLVMDKMKPKVL